MLLLGIIPGSWTLVIIAEVSCELGVAYAAWIIFDVCNDSCDNNTLLLLSYIAYRDRTIIELEHKSAQKNDKYNLNDNISSKYKVLLWK